MKKYCCNITFLALLVLIGCSPKSENTKFSDLPTQEFTYVPRNEDREIVSLASANFDIKNVIGFERAQKNQTPWVSDSVGIFKLAENSLMLGDLLSGSEKAEYKKFGHDLLKLFYQSKENSTQFDRTQTLYLPAALGFEGHKIKNLFTEIGTPNNIQNVLKVFDTHKISWPEQNPTLKPAEFIRSIKAYLNETSALFAKNGVSEGFVKTFAAQVDKDYIQALSKGEVRLADADQNSRLKSNAVLIREVIQTLHFIPQDAIKNLLDSLVKAKQYADMIEPRSTYPGSQKDRLVKVVSNIWLDLNPEQRVKYIKSFNTDVYNKLNDLSDKLLLWFAGKRELELTDLYELAIKDYAKGKFVRALEVNCHPEIYTNLVAWTKMNDAQKTSLRESRPDLFSIFSRYATQEINSDILPNYSESEFQRPFTNGTIVRKFIDDVTPVCITHIQYVLDKSVNAYLLTELDLQIRTWGSMIEKIVKDKTMENLNAIAAATGSDAKFTQYFEKMAYPIMNDMMFNNNTLNGIENSKVQLMVDNKNQFSTKRENLGQFDTGAEVLGVSLAAQYRRILGLPTYENLAATSKDYYRVVFSQINKMLSMIGFRKMDNGLVQSLHRKFGGNIDELDVYKYECSVEKQRVQQAKKERYQAAVNDKKKPNPDDYVDWREDCTGNEGYKDSLYQIPDEMTVVGAFKPGSYKEYSSIRAQSEVIRGSALMLKYFSDWNGENDFDKGLGKETFSEIAVFPKHAFVNLAVAASTTPIRGLQKVGSPLKLFNSLGGEMLDWVTEGIPDPADKDPNAPADPTKQIVQAAITDLFKDGPGKVIQAEDMAYFMLSVDEFLIATDGIEKTHASVINPPDKTVRENMEAIIKGRRLLKMMMFAMSNFMISRMQDNDGGFWSQYVLEPSQGAAGSLKKDTPRTLETQLSVIKALLAVYKLWGSEGALVSAVESYYYMNQKLWNPATAFYRAYEGSNGTEVKPYLYVEAVMNFKNIAPYINNANSQAQAQRMFDSYSKEFLKWNQTSRPMMSALN